MKILDERIGNVRVTLESYEGDSGLHDYGIPRQAWLRAVKFMNHFGPNQALYIIDERAERAADRRDYDSARRWRDLIVAIHAMQEDDHLSGQSTH